VSGGLLGDHYVFQRPVLQFGDAIEVAFLREILSGFGSATGKLMWESAEQFHHLREVVVVFAEGVVVVLVGVEQQFSRQHLEGHAGEGPHVGGQVVFRAQQDFWSSVLTGLYFCGEVVVFPAGVAEICDFNFESLFEFGSLAEDEFGVEGGEEVFRFSFLLFVGGGFRQFVLSLILFYVFYITLLFEFLLKLL
jgi:hypothetical protein